MPRAESAERNTGLTNNSDPFLNRMFLIRIRSRELVNNTRRMTGLCSMVGSTRDCMKSRACSQRGVATRIRMPGTTVNWNASEFARKVDFSTWRDVRNTIRRARES